MDQSARAFLLFASANCFADILGTRGRDITLLLQGLGQQQGLGQLFRRMQKLAWGMASFRVASAAAPQALRIAAVRRVWDWGVAQAWSLWGLVLHMAPGPLASLVS